MRPPSGWSARRAPRPADRFHQRRPIRKTAPKRGLFLLHLPTPWQVDAAASWRRHRTECRCRAKTLVRWASFCAVLPVARTGGCAPPAGVRVRLPRPAAGHPWPAGSTPPAARDGPGYSSAQHEHQERVVGRPLVLGQRGSRKRRPPRPPDVLRRCPLPDAATVRGPLWPRRAARSPTDHAPAPGFLASWLPGFWTSGFRAPAREDSALGWDAPIGMRPQKKTAAKRGLFVCSQAAAQGRRASAASSRALGNRSCLVTLRKP